MNSKNRTGHSGKSSALFIHNNAADVSVLFLGINETCDYKKSHEENWKFSYLTLLFAVYSEIPILS